MLVVLLFVDIGALLLSFPLSQVQSAILDKDQGGRSVFKISDCLCVGLTGIYAPFYMFDIEIVRL